MNDSIRPILIGGIGWQSIKNIRQEPALINGYYVATSKNRRYQNFIKRYKKSANITPPPLAMIAYDVTSLALVVLKHTNYKKKLFFDTGFLGISGTMKFSDYGIILRSYDILQVLPNTIKYQFSTPASSK